MNKNVPPIPKGEALSWRDPQRQTKTTSRNDNRDSLDEQERRHLKLECDRFQSSPWYAVVMGQSGLTFGVSLYENPNILKKMWSGRITEEVNARETVALTLLIGNETEISVLDLEAVRKHGCDVAGPEAYPLIFRKERGMTMRPPLAWELELMEGCLPAIPAFLARHRPDELSKHKMNVPVALGTLTPILSWVEDRDD